jgi:AraC family transcriptional regulator
MGRKGAALRPGLGDARHLFRRPRDHTPPPRDCAEAALAVPEQAQLPKELGERRLAGGRYACTTHVGPYEALGDVWARFMGEWLPSSGQRMRDTVSYEIYRNTPADVPRDKLGTDLYIPLV